MTDKSTNTQNSLNMLVVTLLEPVKTFQANYAEFKFNAHGGRV
jgi:hypothetical protein